MTDTEKSPDKGEGLLVSVAESIGSTLGTLVAKANAAQKSLGKPAKAAARKVAAAKRKASPKRRAGGRAAKRRAKHVAKARSKNSKGRSTGSRKRRTPAR